MKKENLNKITRIINSNDKIVEIYNAQKEIIEQSKHIKKTIKEDKFETYFNFIIFIVAFIIIYYILF